jgi:CheY-like chemotaxis protein
MNNDPITVLLVDDDPDCRMLLREAIAECPVWNRVFEVSQGSAALDFVHRRGPFADAPRPGLIFLDIEMPGISGQEVLRHLKSTPEFRDITVVMMTGVCDEKEMRLAATRGANSYTLKPLRGDELVRVTKASANYWMRIHQYPAHHLPKEECRR